MHKFVVSFCWRFRFWPYQPNLCLTEILLKNYKNGISQKCFELAFFICCDSAGLHLASLDSAGIGSEIYHNNSVMDPKISQIFPLFLVRLVELCMIGFL